MIIHPSDILKDALESIKIGHYVYACNAILHPITYKSKKHKKTIDKAFEIFSSLSPRPWTGTNKPWWTADEHGREKRIIALNKAIELALQLEK